MVHAVAADSKADINIKVVVFDLKEVVHLPKDVTDAVGVRAIDKPIIDKDEKDNPREVVRNVHAGIFGDRF